jgi:hypothetical protein
MNCPALMVYWESWVLPITKWLNDIFMGIGFRGILIGMGLGAVVFMFRVIIGREVGYLGLAAEEEE